MKQTYIVKYRLPNKWIWKKLKNVVDDGVIDENRGSRWFNTKRRERIEIPITCEFRFPEERQDIIEDRQKEELESLPGIKAPLQ